MNREIAFLKATEAPKAVGTERLRSLDAYRGFVMLAMVSASLGTGQLFKVMPHDSIEWKVADQLEHRAWEGCTLWDMIQPSFMFMVGVAMPLAFARRQALGASWLRQLPHALWRTFLLIAIGIVLDSYNQAVPTVQGIRVLQQIAFGYLVAFLLLPFSAWTQAAMAAVLLAGHTAAFMYYGGDRAGDMWVQGRNFGDALDRVLHMPFLNVTSANVLPPSKNGYVHFNAVSSAATILFGVLAGRLLQSSLPMARKAAWLAAAGALGVGLGWALTPSAFASLGLDPAKGVPMVKRIWTASFGLFAAGWTCWTLLVFYLVIEGLKWRSWSLPLAVVGMNSIAVYVAAGLLSSTIRQVLRPFVTGPLEAMGMPGPWQPVVVAVLVTLAIWLLAYWLYRHRIFFKL